MRVGDFLEIKIKRFDGHENRMRSNSVQEILSLRKGPYAKDRRHITCSRVALQISSGRSRPATSDQGESLQDVSIAGVVRDGKLTMTGGVRESPRLGYEVEIEVGNDQCLICCVWLAEDASIRANHG